MELKIGGKDYNLKLGLKSLRFIDELYLISGTNLGQGLHAITIAITSESIGAIANLIKAGTITENQKPSDEDIEEFIGTLTEEEVDKLFKDFLNLLKTQPLTKVMVTKIEKKINKEKEIEQNK